MYAARLIEDLGLRKFKALNQRAGEAKKGKKLTREDYLLLIEKYKEK